MKQDQLEVRIAELEKQMEELLSFKREHCKCYGRVYGEQFCCSSKQSE